MVKISQGDFFGRLGSGIGQGFADTLPREIERGRLASGLERFSQESKGLSPMQQLSKLAAVPGALDNPQLLQSFTELAQRQRLADAYANIGKEGMPSAKEEQGFPREGLSRGYDRTPSPYMQEERLSRRPMEPSKKMMPEESPYGIEPNPYSPGTLPAMPYTPEEFQGLKSSLMRSGLSDSESSNYISEMEKRELATPEARERFIKELDTRREKTAEKFNSMLENKFQKGRPDIYGDLTGDQLAKAELYANKEVLKNRGKDWVKTLDEVTDNLSDLAKAKKSAETAVLNAGPSEIVKRNEAYNKLLTYSKMAEKAARRYQDPSYLEEFKDNLVTSGLSPQASANISYPLKGVFKNIAQTKRDSKKESPEVFSQRIADEALNNISEYDSLLSLANEMKRKHRADFNEQQFFNRIRKNYDQYEEENPRLHARIGRELIQGESGIVPFLKDLWILPWFNED